jgi:hypothetical protein
MPYGLKFVLYVIVAFVITFFVAWMLGPLGRVVNIIFSFAAAGVAILIARRIFA